MRFPSPFDQAEAARAKTPRHHPVFDRFERTRPFDDDRHHHNFMGTRIAHAFERDLAEAAPEFGTALYKDIKSSGRSAVHDDDSTFPYRNSEDYFEWIDLLTAIDRAEGRFVMIEAGAGYGRWIANAAAALKRRRKKGIIEQKLIALEANQARFLMMQSNCVDNGISDADVELIRAACTPDGSPVFMVCNDDYGARVLQDESVMAKFAEMQTERLPGQDQTGRRVEIEKVPAVRLADLIREPIDFLDVDIQGAELDVIFASIEAMNRLVKIAHVGTHSFVIDSRLAHLFHLHGWRPRHLYSFRTVNRTPYGECAFIDGIQSWENPRFDRTIS